MQARAIFEAAAEAASAPASRSMPEVMVPLIATKAEFDMIKARIDAWRSGDAGNRREARISGRHHDRAAARLPAAGEIAETAEFFSFGTNDLTQTTFGISRDDAAIFLGTYLAQGISRSIRSSRSISEGVGELVKIGVERGRKTRPDIKLGICGEHGGDPASVAFCHETGSTTCRARRTACRSRASRRRRPRSVSSRQSR
jgi:pyruvate,orthophosphate dikinase